MTTLIVPNDEMLWPTLGPQVCAFIEQNEVHGPGDLRGQRVTLDEDTRLWLYSAYEIYPEGHEAAGRRRFQRVVISEPKGVAKTEQAAFVAGCELHPEAPVRCDGWRDVVVHGEKRREPVGRGVVDPYIPMVAYTEEQTEDLAYAALMVVLGEGPLADDFDIGLDRIVGRDGRGRAAPLAAAPNARDGARTTFQHADETHHWVTTRLKKAHQIMQANLPKRFLADAWGLETSTAYETGAGSVHEEAMAYALAIAEGKAKNSRLFFMHRQADPQLDFAKPDERRKGVIEARGAAAKWSNIDAICALFDDPNADIPLLERLYGNRPTAGGGRAFPLETWKGLKSDFVPPKKSLITLGFDGSKYLDATALVATHVETGFQWPLGIWERPTDPKVGEGWEVPASDVDDAVDRAFGDYDVWRMYGDPYFWEESLAQWRGKYGDKKVIEFRTTRLQVMVYAVKSYLHAMQNGDISHDGDKVFAEHIGHACKRATNIRDETGATMWVISKDRSDSIFKIDGAMAGVLSWEARNDAIAAGVLNPPAIGGMSIYVPE